MVMMMIAVKAALLAGVASGFGHMGPEEDNSYFSRVATFPVCAQPGGDCETDELVTAPEIIAYHAGSKTAVYSDSELGAVGFVDMTTPASPMGLGAIDVGGEPTSVAILGDYVVVGVNTSPSFTEPSGFLAAVDIASRTVVKTWDLGGQPDSVTVSPDGSYVAVAIENERDEDLNDGDIPQLPAGYLVVVDVLPSSIDDWQPSIVHMTGLAGCFAPSDPEPEYVAINADNIAVVTMQENNCIALVHLATKRVTMSFDAGRELLQGVDLTEDEVVDQSAITVQKREPDGVAWIGTEYFATANEGDYEGGSRSFTIWSKAGAVVYSSGIMLDRLAARYGHYPEARSANKGAEPENVVYGVFGTRPLLFVNLERSSLCVVFDVSDVTAPTLVQALPTASGPEGAVVVPEMGMLLVASEVDAREDKLRAAVNVYLLDYEDTMMGAPPFYPTLVSADRADGSPIPFAALSGLAPGADGSTLYSVEDSFFASSRIFTIATSSWPYVLHKELRIVDRDGVLAASALTSPYLEKLVNADGTVNLDPEGIAFGTFKGEEVFIVASEGAGTANDPAAPVTSLNYIFVVQMDGTVAEVIGLPDSLNAVQLRFGFEGVALVDGRLYVAMQRAWNGEPNPRIAVYDPETAGWTFFFYPLETPSSPLGGWVGLSDITPLGGMQFLVLERDNQGGPDARIKWVCMIDLDGATPLSTLAKSDCTDLMPMLTASGGLVPEKIEGLAAMPDGSIFIVNDNDGVDDNSGEIQLIKY